MSCHGKQIAKMSTEVRGSDTLELYLLYASKISGTIEGQKEAY